MKRYFLLSLLALGICAVISSCCCCKKKSTKTETTTTAPVPDYAAEGYLKAAIIKHNLDGCSWMIELEDKSKKEPQNLGEEFKKEGMKIWVKYSVPKGAMSICMAGEIVKIEDIKERK